MKVLILAGGHGTRLSEETGVRPKPMVEIGGKPILWHIMKIFSAQGFNDFVILLGYKGYIIKEYFIHYYLHQSDLTIDLQTNSMIFHHNTSEPWKVTLLDTGHNSMTGGRIKRAASYIGNDTFLLTYGDGVADIDLQSLLATHKSAGSLVTMTTIQPEGRFGQVETDMNNRIIAFKEKPKGDQGWINGGFFACEPGVLDYLDGDETVFEHAPLEKLASEGRLYMYRHQRYWKCMDTLRDKVQLEESWIKGNAPWKIWTN